MSYEDKTIKCADCGVEFVFSAGEQEFYASKGFQNAPLRCKACRMARKANAHQVICAACGRETTVKIRLKEDRPVYCSECYAKLREAKG